MRRISHIGFAMTVLVFAGLVSAQQPDDKAPVDYDELSRLIHKVVVAQVPKVIEDDSGWGQTVAIPEKLRLPKLQRTFIKVGDRWEVPHGFWRKVKASLPEPAKNVQIQVRDLKSAGPGAIKLTVDADIALRGWAEAQHWRNGLALVGFIAEADAVIGLNLVCDVAIAVDTKKFPPDVKVTPKVAELKTDLREFSLREVKMRRLAVTLEGEAAREAGNQFKGLLQQLMRNHEPKVKELANEAIARSLREGKGNLSAEAMLKLFGMPVKEK
jgi:hypothetical protein